MRKAEKNADLRWWKAVIISATSCVMTGTITDKKNCPKLDLSASFQLLQKVYSAKLTKSSLDRIAYYPN